MSKITEDIVQQELHKAFLALVRRMNENGCTFAQMTAISGESEEKVVAALRELNIPIPD